MDESVAQMIPLHKGDRLGKVKVGLFVSEETLLEVELRVSSKPFNHTPDVTLETKTVSLCQGKQQLELTFEAVMPEEQYVFLVFKKNPLVQLQYTHFGARSEDPVDITSLFSRKKTAMFFLFQILIMALIVRFNHQMPGLQS